jgi:magnesium transporter
MSSELQLAASFATRHQKATAHILESHAAADAAAFIETLEAESAASLVAQMSPSSAARCLSAMGADRAAEFLGLIGYHRAVLALRWLDGTERDAIISRLPTSFASRIQRLLRYPKGSAGWLADNSAAPLPHDYSVAAARKGSLNPRFPYVYLVDADQRLVGATHISDILASPDGKPLNTIARTDPISVSARTTAADLRSHRAWAKLDVLPVVDSRGRYIGALRHKVLRRLYGPRSMAGDVDPSLLSILELAELYWKGLASVFLPISRTCESAADQERPHDS